MTKRKIEYWVIPQDQDAEFVAAMEDVLEIYAKAYDPHHPVLCMDEQPIQLLERDPGADPGHENAWLNATLAVQPPVAII